MKIPPEHPRAKSLLIRERLVEYYNEGAVAASGLIATAEEKHSTTCWVKRRPSQH